MDISTETPPIRVLVAARHPVRVEDLGIAHDDGIVVSRLVRWLPSLAEAVDEDHADVVLIDFSFPEGRAFGSISELRATSPDTAIIALLHEPIDRSTPESARCPCERHREGRHPGLRSRGGNG